MALLCNQVCGFENIHSTERRRKKKKEHNEPIKFVLLR